MGSWEVREVREVRESESLWERGRRDGVRLLVLEACSAGQRGQSSQWSVVKHAIASERHSRSRIAMSQV